MFVCVVKHCLFRPHCFSPVTIMSAISSQLSFPTSGHWTFNPRVFNIMDSIYAIAFGLGLRTLVDAVSQDLKLTGSLIGLWEGVITLHFLKKMPKSSDPYIAYGVRLFIDFLITESMERLVLVLIWTAFGLVLADVTPAIWDEVGLNRVWRHFRRDLYTIYDKIPTVAFFPPQRTVRFLPPRERERERERDSREISPSTTPSEGTPIAVIPPLPSEPSETLKHRVPGFYPGDFSDTDTDFGSINRSRTSLRTEIDNAIGSTHHRLSTMPKLNLSYSVSDLDEGNQSSAISSPSVTHNEIPDMEEVLVDTGINEEVPPVLTPKRTAYIPMPPTPSDSAARDIHRDVAEGVLLAKPPPQDLPNIIDSGEDGGTSDDWEKIHRRELDEDASPTPPTPPEKDRPVDGGGLSLQIPPILPAVTENRRESLPPAYSANDHANDLDDIYYYPDDEKPTVTAADDHVNVNEHAGNDNDDNNDLSNIFFQQAGDSDINTGASANPWAGPTSSDATTAQAQADAAKMQAEEDDERKRKEEEENRILKKAEERRLKEEKEEEERRWKEVEDARKRMEEEKERKEAEEKRIRKEAEEERIRKEAEEERIRKEAEEERKRKEAEEEKIRKEAEEERTRKEAEAERIRKEEEERKRKEEEEKERKAAEEEKIRKEAEELRREKEAEKKRIAEEIRKKEQDDDVLRKQKQAEAKEAEQRRKDEEAAKKMEEDALKKEKEQEAAKKEVEEQEARDIIEKQMQDEAAAHAQKETEEAKLKSEAKEAAETEIDQAELDKQKADTPGGQATEEKEDDSKTVHGVDISGQHQQGPSEADNVQDSTPHADFTEEESVISTATADPPREAKVRLERMMILRAQMVEVEKRLDELKGRGLDETTPERKALEKTLRKFRRQAERRYDAGMLFFKL